MKTVILAMFLALTGCGTIDSIKNSKDTDFVVVSQSRAGGVVRWIQGESTVCKLSKHGVTGLNYQITFNNGDCLVEAVK